MTIYIFGNPLLPQDSLPIKLLPRLKKAFPNTNFIIKDPTENWTDGEKEITIIDTVIGIKKVTVFNSLNSFQQAGSRISPHDYDVYMDITLLQKLGKVKKVCVIGVPQKEDPNKLLAALALTLQSLR